MGKHELGEFMAFVANSAPPHEMPRSHHPGHWEFQDNMTVLNDFINGRISQTELISVVAMGLWNRYDWDFGAAKEYWIEKWRTRG